MEETELLARRLHGLLLTAPQGTPVRAAADLCGLQAQFLRNALYSLRLRTGSADPSGLCKTWTLRGTVHLIPENDLGLYLHQRGTAEDVCDTGWYRWQASRSQANPPDRERFFARLMVEAIAEGNATREGLRAYLRACGMTETEERRLFDSWGGLIGELASLGVIVHEIRQEKAYRLAPPYVPLSPEDANRELARRYFTHYGPATLRDAAYFFHVPQKTVKAWLRDLPLREDTAGGQTVFFLGGETQEIPRVRLLAGFDPLMLGYRKEDNPALPPEYLRGIFNLAGIVHPALLLRGRVVGRWKEANGLVTFTPFTDIADADRKAIASEAERLFPVRRITWEGLG